MATPLQDFEARVEEISSDVEFLTLAIKLRPRLGDIIRWDAHGDVLELARSFVGTRSRQPEATYGAVMIRLLAAFERYLRNLVDSIVDRRSAAAATYDQLPTALSNRNIALTGRVLSAIDTPRDHLVFNIGALIDNLATCKPGSTKFRLNASVFSAVVSGSSPTAIERALHSVDVTEFWDTIGGNDKLAKSLGTKGNRATGERVKDRLKELWRWRNHLAHGGDEEIALSEAQLREIITFVTAFAKALDDAINKQLKKLGVA